MSKQKTNEPETENEVTGNLTEQNVLDGLETAEVTESKTVTTDEVPKVTKKLNPKINTVATAAVKANKKMGVYKFLSLYPQDIYIDTLLRFYYPHSFYTKDEWFMRIEELLDMPINN